MSTAPARFPRIGSPWARAAIGAVSILVFLIASHIAFVALYSYVMMPGQELAHYQEFAQLTGSPFATVLGLWVSYLVAGWVIGSATNPWPPAAMLVAAYLALEALAVVGMGLASALLTAPQLLGMLSTVCGVAIAASLRPSSRSAPTAVDPTPAAAR